VTIDKQATPQRGNNPQGYHPHFDKPLGPRAVLLAPTRMQPGGPMPHASLQSTGESSVPRVPLATRCVSRRRAVAKAEAPVSSTTPATANSPPLFSSIFLPKLVAVPSLIPNAARQCFNCLDFAAARMELLDSRLLLLCCLVVPIVYHVYNRRKERQVIAQSIPLFISKTC
jgi:hypothetical protein